MPIKVLLVEDNPDDALLIDRALDRYSREHPGTDFYLQTVLTRRGLENALTEQAWDIIVCDYRLGPDMEWPAILRILESLNLKIPVIVTSGAVSDAEGVQAIRDGAADYIGKDLLVRLGHMIVREAFKAEAYNKLVKAHERVLHDL